LVYPKERFCPSRSFARNAPAGLELQKTSKVMAHRGIIIGNQDSNQEAATLLITICRVVEPLCAIR